MVVMVCKPLLLIDDCERLKTYTSSYFARIRRVIDKTQKNIYKFKKIEIEKEEWRREREIDTYTFFLGLEISMEYHK